MNLKLPDDLASQAKENFKNIGMIDIEFEKNDSKHKQDKLIEFLALLSALVIIGTPCYLRTRRPKSPRFKHG